MRSIEGEGADEGYPSDPLLAPAWPLDADDTDFDGRGGEQPAGPGVFLGAADGRPLRARVRISVDGRPTLLTIEPHLREGDVVYLDTRGERRPHRVAAMRRGLRMRDHADLRIAQLDEVAG